MSGRSTDALSQLIAAAQVEGGGSDEIEGRGLPPVHLWHPDHCGEIDIRIARDGLWFHDGTPIGRLQLVRLFSTVLRRDPDGFHLVTPVEKLKIKVDDAPFTAIRVEAKDGVLRFITNVGDRVEAGPEHDLRVEADPSTGEPRPYLHVRAGLEALVIRPVFYELVSLGSAHDGRLRIASNGRWFDLGPLEAGA